MNNKQLNTNDMKKNILHFGIMAKLVMIGLLLWVAGMMKGYAYGFSAVCESGQTLYYNIINTTNHYVELTYPGSSMLNPWDGYTKPEGEIILPEYVNYEGTMYTITKIGYCAFSNCTGLLGDLIIPNTITNIDYRAFYNCIGFTGNLVLGNSLNNIGQEAFFCCINLTGNLIIPDSVTTIGWKAFKECSNFSGALTIGNSVESIVSEAFYNCNGISSFSIPISVYNIGENAFFGTGWYNNHSNGILYQNNWCLGYKGTPSGSLTISTNTRGIANHAFYGMSFNKVYYNAINCLGVEGDNIPPFQNCSGTLIIGNNVERIPSSMFRWASFSGNVIIPNSVTEIGNNAFDGCFSLVGFSLSNSIVSIGQNAFYDTGWYINHLDGVLYIDDWCIGNKGTQTGSLSIQEGTKGIADYAFSDCRGFNGYLTFPNSLVYIGNSAFYNCRFVGSLIIPNAVITIGYSAFLFCTNFNGLVLPNSINSIGNGAFYFCTGITYMTVFADNPPILGEIVFENVNKSIPVQVPHGTMTAYMSAPGWNEFTNYQEMPPVNTTQSVELSTGWNWFSPNVEITLEDLQDALVDALPNANAIMIKSKNGITTYNGDTWRGQLDSLDVTQMYRISVSTACEITLEGIPIIPAEHPIFIHNGVNWIGFPLSENMTLNEAFSGFVVAGDMVKSKNGVATYNGTDWRGSLDTLEPGQGYIYKSNVQEDRTFTFPVSTK